MGKITVRVFTLDQIGPEGLSTQFADPHRHIAMCDGAWIKMIRANPAARGDDLAMLLALDDETVVGRLGFHAGAATIAGKQHRIHWMDGYFLDESYRSSGVGGLIMLQASARCKSILACGGPSENAQKLYKAAGLKELGPLRRWVYFTSGIAPARKIFGESVRTRLVAPLAGGLLRGYYLTRRRGARSRLTYQSVERFTSELDAIHANPPQSYFPRDAATLNWALAHRRLKGFEIRRDQQIVGYVLLKRNRIDFTQHGLGHLTAGWMVDYYLADATDTSKQDLALFVIDYFRSTPGDGTSQDEQGIVDVVDLQSLDPAFDRICRSLGLLHKGGLRVLFRPPPGVQLPPPEEWFITAAAGDMLLAPP